MVLMVLMMLEMYLVDRFGECFRFAGDFKWFAIICRDIYPSWLIESKTIFMMMGDWFSIIFANYVSLLVEIICQFIPLLC